MKDMFLTLMAGVIQKSTEKERREWPPKCEIGVWYQPKRPTRSKVIFESGIIIQQAEQKK